MTSLESDLRRRARHAYARGRWRHASRLLWVIAPLVGAAMLISNAPITSLALGCVLMVVVCLARFRGGLLGSAATIGVLAGLPAYLVPMIGGWSSDACGGACCADWCMTLCCSGGLITGVALGVFASVQQRAVLHLSIAVMISGLTAAVGCNAYGLTSLAALLGAAAVMSGSMVLLRPAVHRA